MASTSRLSSDAVVGGTASLDLRTADVDMWRLSIPSLYADPAPSTGLTQEVVVPTDPYKSLDLTGKSLIVTRAGSC